MAPSIACCHADARVEALIAALQDPSKRVVQHSPPQAANLKLLAVLTSLVQPRLTAMRTELEAQKAAATTVLQGEAPAAPADNALAASATVTANGTAATAASAIANAATATAAAKGPAAAKGSKAAPQSQADVKDAVPSAPIPVVMHQVSVFSGQSDTWSCIVSSETFVLVTSRSMQRPGTCNATVVVAVHSCQAGKRALSLLLVKRRWQCYSCPKSELRSAQ